MQAISWCTCAGHPVGLLKLLGSLFNASEEWPR